MIVEKYIKSLTVGRVKKFRNIKIYPLKSDLSTVSNILTHEGAGNKLLDQVDSGMRLLRLMPELAPVYAERYRRLVLRDPRFGIFYIPEPRGIIVHAICDLRQERKAILRHLDIWDEQ